MPSSGIRSTCISGRWKVAALTKLFLSLTCIAMLGYAARGGIVSWRMWRRGVDYVACMWGVWRTCMHALFCVVFIRVSRSVRPLLGLCSCRLSFSFCSLLPLLHRSCPFSFGFLVFVVLFLFSSFFSPLCSVFVNCVMFLSSFALSYPSSFPVL